MDTGRDPGGSADEITGKIHRHILQATAAMERAYARTALPAEAVGAVLTTGFIALALADAWLPGFRMLDAGPLTTAAAAWMLAAILTYMIYVPRRYTESRMGPETKGGWKRDAGDAALMLPLALIAAGLLMAAQWDSPAVETAAGYTLFAGLTLAALRTAAGLAGRVRRRKT